MKTISKTTTEERLAEPIGFRLRTKFILGIVVLECLLVAAVTFLVEYQMRDSILDQFLKRGFFIARNLALLNTMSTSSRMWTGLRRRTASPMRR